MSGASAHTDIDDDATPTMTRDASASRTFRSIFSGAMRHESDELEDVGELKLHHFHRSSSSTFSDSTGYRHTDDIDDIDDSDDDDGVWSDDAASPRPSKDLLRDDDGSDNNHAAMEHRAATDNEQDAFAATSSSDSEAAVAVPPRVIPHRRSMEEWADDDDEEDAWKDLLQDKVNQLELVIQSNDDAQQPDTRIALSTATAAATSFGALRGAPIERSMSRNKLQRTSGTSSDGSVPPSQLRQPVGGLHLPPAPAGVSSPSSYLRKRSGSRDFTPSLVSKLCGDAKRTVKKPASGSSRRESLPRSASTSAITRSGARTAPRKNSFDATHGGAVRPKPSGAAAALPPAAQRAISDAEAVRRFLLHDIKQMSMDRLVADAKRLQVLEAFYKQQTQTQTLDRSADASPGATT